MQNVKNLNPVAHLRDDTMTRSVVVSNRVIALWHTMIGKKVVMAVTGVVLIGFVIAHMLGNLKIFLGPNEINAYSRFLREVGWPELSYGQLLWLVRIVLFVCVTLHITAAIQLTRMSRAARPIGYTAKRDIETTWGARTMRWGGVLTGRGRRWPYPKRPSRPAGRRGRSRIFPHCRIPEVCHD
jgi:succinate dehydrogenase / fumarate reductase cytochrome b subunit